MTKTILIIAIAATLILGTFALGNTASAVVAGDKILLIGKDGTVTCNVEIPCQVEKIRIKMDLNVQDASVGFIAGDGKSKIDMKGEVLTGDKMSLDSIVFDWAAQISNGQAILEGSGFLIDDDDHIWSANITTNKGTVNENGVMLIDVNIILVDEHGNTMQIQIDFTSAGIITPVL